MSLSIGIVGLPNVGKSTLFKTLTKKEVDIANYPFCTIDPNVGVVLVPDERVDKLAELSYSAKKIYATVNFVDIAGLVKGASQGEGLGNKFLSHIREVDAVLYVLRAFKNSDIVNTQNEVNPLKEKEVLDLELILKDLETIDKILGKNTNALIRANKGFTEREFNVIEKVKDFLTQEKILVDQEFTNEEKEILNNYQLLTLKPRLFLLNGSENEIDKSWWDVGRPTNTVIVDVQSEYEAEGMSRKERRELGLLELSETDILAKKSYEILNLITFLTTGKDETRAWTIKKGDTAPIAGAAIHSDFQEKFVKAEVVFWKDLLEAGSYAKAREKGLIRTEGREYIVRDGDVIEFKHG